MITNPQESVDEVVRATLCFGQLGSFNDLSQINNIIHIFSNLFSSPEKRIQDAAAISLGSISIGNPSFFLEKVFQMIDKSDPKQKYMFLSTIREIITNKPECLQSYINKMMELYIE